MSRAVVAGVAAGVLVLASGWWWLGRGGDTATDVASPSPMAASPLPGGGAPVVRPSIAPGGALPPAAGMAPAGAMPTRPVTTAKPRLEEIQAELTALRAGGRTPQAAEMDAVFEKLERYSGNGVLAGVDLRAVRSNLQAAARIQALSEQMKPLAADPTPENVQKLQALLGQMRQAQTSMNTEMSASTTSAR